MHARGRRRLLLALVVVLVIGAPASAPPSPAAGQWQAEAELRVEAITDEHPELHISIDLADKRGKPGLITIDVPRRAGIDPLRPAGSAVGSVFIYAEDSSYGTPTQTTLAGTIVAQAPPATVAECAVDSPIGLWVLKLSLLGQPFDIPLYLTAASPGDPAGTGAKIVLCVPSLPNTDPATARALPILSIYLSLSGPSIPRARGSYLWRAIVTPLGPDRHTLSPGHTYELRALVPVPHLLTLTGRYRQRDHSAVLRGRLVANGKARPNVPIQIVSLIRRITPNGVRFDDLVAGGATTDRSGNYTFRTPTRKTTTYVANAEPTTTRCQGPRTTPGGCLSTTTTTTESDPITVNVP